MSVIAKFRCEHIQPHITGDGHSISLRAVYSDEPGHPNHSWSKWTPSGQLQMSITNPAAYDQFEIGKEYMIEIKPA